MKKKLLYVFGGLILLVGIFSGEPEDPNTPESNIVQSEELPKTEVTQEIPLNTTTPKVMGEKDEVELIPTDTQMPTQRIQAPINTPTPTQNVIVYPTNTPVQIQNSVYSPSAQNSASGCNCSKTCGEMASCDEAYYQLNTCGCSARDADNDGIPCEAICK
jgi:hypothetical protein